MDNDPFEPYLPFLLTAAIALIVYFVVRRKAWNIRIAVRNGEVTVRGRIALAKAILIRNFWQEQLAEVRNGRVMGFWNGRTLRLHFSRTISVAQRQRIRNYLLSIL